MVNKSRARRQSSTKIRLSNPLQLEVFTPNNNIINNKYFNDKFFYLIQLFFVMEYQIYFIIELNIILFFLLAPSTPKKKGREKIVSIGLVKQRCVGEN